MANTPNDPARTGAEGGAQVYHEKSKGFPWWAWLLLAVVLLGLLLALLNRHGTPQAATAPATNSAPAAADTSSAPSGAVSGHDIKIHKGTDIATAKPQQASVPGVPLSDVVTFAAATDPLSFAGRRAKLTAVPVLKVLSDRAFFVGPSAQQQILVLLDKGLDAGAGSGSKVTIATGQPISLIGVIEKMPTQEAISQQYQISGANYTAIQSQKAYLHATVAQQK
ncbi:MAG: hypothetical protein ACRYFS_11735 [Janthinobacterium lividum]